MLDVTRLAENAGVTNQLLLYKTFAAPVIARQQRQGGNTVVKALRTQAKGEFKRYRPSNALSTMNENLYAQYCPLTLLRACLGASLAQFHPLAHRVS
jgi:hypothetical protein